MSNVFSPRLDILPAPQQRLWPELAQTPDQFILYGGTAIALRLGHRQSVDFDFIAAQEFDPDAIYVRFAFLRDSTPVQKAANALTCEVDRGGLVRVSFFGAPSVHLLEPPSVAPDNRLHVASLLDLAGMKAALVQKRAEAKDYLDVDAIIQSGRVDLSTALAAARAIYGSVFRPELTLKSLSFFGDGTLPTLPEDVRHRLVEAVRTVNLNELPRISPHTT